MSRTARPSGTCSSSISRWPSACWNFHIHCLPTTYTSSASRGGRTAVKKTLAPQAYMTIASASGTIVQVSSSAIGSWTSSVSSSSLRRWYLMAK